jgi:hypothetical protein
MARADAALYRSKHEGRNRVSCDEAPTANDDDEPTQVVRRPNLAAPLP